MRDERGWSKEVKDSVIFNKMYGGFESRLKLNHTLHGKVKSNVYVLNSCVVNHIFCVISQFRCTKSGLSKIIKVFWGNLISSFVYPKPKDKVPFLL